jgi:hypothetical protein
MVEFNTALKSFPERLLVLNLGVLPEGMPADVVYKDASPRNLVGLIDDIKRKIGRNVN